MKIAYYWYKGEEINILFCFNMLSEDYLFLLFDYEYSDCASKAMFLPMCFVQLFTQFQWNRNSPNRNFLHFYHYTAKQQRSSINTAKSTAVVVSRRKMLSPRHNRYSTAMVSRCEVPQASPRATSHSEEVTHKTVYHRLYQPRPLLCSLSLTRV